MNYRIIPVTAFQQNCSLLWCEQSHKGALIDPGGDSERLLAIVEQEEVELELLLLTHGHVDHVSAAGELAARLGIPVVGPQQEDAFWLAMLPDQARHFGFPPTDELHPDRWLEDGEEVCVGELRLRVLHCPGHTPGHIIFFEPQSRIAFVGDVLFHGSIGRTDFPRGDYATLMHSIRGKLLPLGDDVTFVPGHGPSATLGEERRHNPFLQGE